jgi:hypothetical protein
MRAGTQPGPLLAHLKGMLLLLQLLPSLQPLILQHVRRCTRTFTSSIPHRTANSPSPSHPTLPTYPDPPPLFIALLFAGLCNVVHLPPIHKKTCC